MPRPVPRSIDVGVACAVSDAGHREAAGAVVGDRRPGAVQRDEPRAETHSLARLRESDPCYGLRDGDDESLQISNRAS